MRGDRIMIIDGFWDAVMDTVRTLPFLLAAFVLLEVVEHYSGGFMNRALGKVGKAGPAVGAVFGCVPQCGFSVAAANLYAGGIISLGTLLAVFVSTSDEAVLILLGHPGSAAAIGKLLLSKVVAGALIGFAVDLLFRKHKEEKHVEELCRNCGCSDAGGIWMPAFRHTVRLAVYLLIFTFALNVLLEWIGIERLMQILGKDTMFQPFLAPLLGLIPNCASSVLITELYLAGGLSFASAAAGLCAGAGVGLAVLFKANHPMKENVKILALLYFASAAVGLVLEIFM